MADDLVSGRMLEARIAEELLQDAVARAELRLEQLKALEVPREHRPEWRAHSRLVAEAEAQLVLAEEQLEWLEQREMGQWSYILRRGTLRWSLLTLAVVIGAELSRGASETAGSFGLIAGFVLAGAGVGAFAGWIGWHNREQGHEEFLRSLEPGKHAGLAT